MSFGWSVGDVISGLKVVWDIWQAVSDGPLNARFEAAQFFDEYVHIMSRLEKWESRKAAFSKDELLAKSQRQLREQCTLFLKNHIRLIQEVNPNTIAKREGRSTWLKKVPFSTDQILALYQQVEWPLERQVVAKLRIKLQFFLDVASFDVALDTNDTIHQMRTENVDLMSSNLKLVTSHLELVSLVKDNLRRITNPLEPGRQASEIDYPMLRQFDQALRVPQALPRPQPMLAIEAGQVRPVPWEQTRSASQLVDAQYAVAQPVTSAAQNANGVDHNDIRDLIERRLDNLSMRVKRVETLETISENEADEDASIQSLLEHLKLMRGRIGNAVGVLRRQSSQNGLSLMVNNPEGALKAELEAWDLLESRMEREILHPPHPVRRQIAATSIQQNGPTRPMDIPRRQTLSPRAQYDGLPGSMSSSPDNSRGSFSSSPTQSRPISHSRSGSHSSQSRPVSIRLDQFIPVTLYASEYTFNGIIHTLRRNAEGEVEKIIAFSNDGNFKVYHSIDFQTPAPVETTMKPFLDNRHVCPDEAHKWRVQFKGAHHLKIMTVSGTQEEKLFGSMHSPPIYRFNNDNDFKEFQRLLLNKEVKYLCDVCRIDPTTGSKHSQCHLGTIRILLDPFSKTRSILYFRHTPEHKGFVEWPVNNFKPPREPTKKSKLLTLHSLDDKPLSQSRNLARRSTSGSVATMASFETQPGNALARNQDKTNLKGLVIEFHSSTDCHTFWSEFNTKETTFQLDLDLHGDLNQENGLGLDFGSRSPS
ncbi:uncharacterized protein LY89DRAFT_8011 [Mollisia scopiformis]|uniref:Uncharacterized protein n=1 Tax=Mollisia scopiformis TaxID=149040 RepID=A0A194XUH5_MOLSC|nr:uncharacterized protein LY89DRAFT_8011 [Mollisia scopiformis]KUJ23970.1 hypothetical protein LY89DRAFT_8011 [Mollisia scopiformis]